jgi:hypothetical protein
MNGDFVSVMGITEDCDKELGAIERWAPSPGQAEPARKGIVGET